MIGLSILGLALWTGLQFRPARRSTWQRRWAALQRFGCFLSAVATLAWWTFLKEPAQALWSWDRTRRAGAGLDTALNQILHRD